MTEAKRPRISVVIPVYNEEKNLPRLIDELEEHLVSYDYEVVFIDDGSTDDGLRILKERRELNKRLKIVQFNDNFGQQAAFTAGYRVAKGEIIVTLDADLQNDPADIRKFVDALDIDENQAAFGWRINRENDLLMRKLPSKLFNWLRNRLLHRPLHDYGCAINAFRREFVDELADTPVFLKHITTHIARKRVPYVEVQVRERQRHAGESHYDLVRLVQLALDLLITASPKPVATSVLFATCAVSFFLFVVSLALVLPSLLTGGGYTVGDLLYPYLFFVSAAICGSLVLVNEKLFILLHQVYKKPLYIIKEYLD